jgi:RNA polymerase sigma factor (sigma-70 family)
MDPRTLSLKELLRLCLESNDQAAWREFVRRVQPTIARVVKNTLGRIRYWKRSTPQEIDDLVHDTFVKLFANDSRALRDFECQHDEELFGFVKVVASNVVLDYLRHMLTEKLGGGRAEEDLDNAQHVPASGFGSPKTAERNILMGQIQRCLESHASDPNYARDCRIFWLYYQQGFTAKAISELPGIGLGVEGVESALLRMVRLIRECMRRRSGKASGAGG